MEYDRCWSVSNTTIKRCRNFSKKGTIFCKKHDTCKQQLYNGAVVEYKNNIDNIKSISNPIYQWYEFNKTYFSSNNQKELSVQGKIIRSGNQKKVIDTLVDEKVFFSNQRAIYFFSKKAPLKRGKKIVFPKLTKEQLERARHFLGVIYFFKRKEYLLRKIQVMIRVKLKYGKDVKMISKIQKYYRHKRWLSRLPVQPKVLVNHYGANVKEIISLQRKVRKHIRYKVKHSHPCPYSQEDYWDIPKKYRVFYKYKTGDITHWRYYDIRWLHIDFRYQCETKRFVVEPCTKEEFPNSFLEMIAKKIWRLTRIEKDNLLLDEYVIEDDWRNGLRNRSFYCFMLMVLDLGFFLNIEIPNINQWQTEDFIYKYQMFYLQTMPAIKSIALNCNFPNIAENIYYNTRDLFTMNFIFRDSNVGDQVAAKAVGGLISLIYKSRWFILPIDNRNNTNIHHLIMNIIKENVILYLL
jgi:hypothetical protein